jgi:hypothetical protein
MRSVLALVAVAVAPAAASADAHRFMRELAGREAPFYRAGVAFDGKTAMTHDGHDVDFTTGRLRPGGLRNWSAASKESLHLAILVKSLGGDGTARRLIPARRALAQLEKKIASYERFDREHPGYGGFLPWYRVERGRVLPMPDWANRVPGLDNGQLAWSIYVAAHALEDLGHRELAARYRAHLERMKRNVVRIFYDPAAKKLRAEARLVAGNAVAPTANRYANNVPGYFLDDAYEGVLLNHFADLFGDWRGHEAGREALWSAPRRIPAGYTTRQGRRLTVVRGHWFSSHEDWAYLVLPFLDDARARRLFVDAQRVRIDHARASGLPGLFASTHETITGPGAPGYVSNLGIAAVAKLPVTGRPILAPYAAFPLALANRRWFTAWLGTMLARPHMLGPYGMGESFSPAGGHAPVLTWDGKALPMVAWMKGTVDETRRYLRRDGLYDRFMARVRADYRLFDGPTAAAAAAP